MGDDRITVVGTPSDPSAERCRENARRLQILRERLAAERGETPRSEERDLIDEHDAAD